MRIGFLSSYDLNLYLFRLNLMRELIKRGHIVYAISPLGNYSSKFREFGITHIPYQMDRESLNPFKELLVIKSIYNSIKDLNLDLIHTFTLKPNIYATFASKKANIPIILNLVEGLGSFYIEDNIKNKIIRYIIERLYKSAFKHSNKVVFVNSDDPQYMLDKKIIDKEKIEIIKSVGIDTNNFSIKNIDSHDLNRLKDTLGLNDKIVILMVARAIWHKGVREFYKVASYFKDDKRVKFVLVGDVDKSNPSSVSKEFLTKNRDVLWLGHRDDIKEITALSDIYVLPSYREGIPRTLLEAASMSKPIVTTNSVGCREVVDDGINGFLVPIKDTKTLYEKIKILIDNNSLREKMAKASRDKAVKEFDLKKVISKYIKLYNEYIDV